MTARDAPPDPFPLPPAVEGDFATGSSAPPTSPGAPAIEAAIGATIRALRHRHGLTVAELASQAGLSPGMLSKIETGSTSPSLSSLQALAQALSVPLTRLFEEFEQQRDVSYVPAGQGVVIERRGTKVGHRYQLIGHTLSRRVAVEPYLITLDDQAVPYGGFRHEGLEFIYMLKGSVGYRHGQQIYQLNPGDALFFDSASAHGPEDLGELPAEYLSIIIYPRD